MPEEMPFLMRDLAGFEWAKYHNRVEAWEKKNPSKRMVGWISLDDEVYVGLTKKGEHIRNGFFQTGEWECMTMREAIKAIKIALARFDAAVATDESGYYGSMDYGDLEIYVPHTTKIN
jgi:hypothetical protein